MKALGDRRELLHQVKAEGERQRGPDKGVDALLQGLQGMDETEPTPPPERKAKAAPALQYKCPHCEQAFGRPRLLEEHEAEAHNMNAEPVRLGTRRAPSATDLAGFISHQFSATRRHLSTPLFLYLLTS